MAYKTKTLEEYQQKEEKTLKQMERIKREMRGTIKSYYLSYAEPRVHLTTHASAGIVQMRWRMLGNQKYVELDSEEIIKQIIISETGVKKKYDIFYFEYKRISLNRDYAILFAIQRRTNMAIQKTKNAALVQANVK